MEKLDLRKQFQALYSPSAKEISLVEVPPFQFAMLDGEIEPGNSPSTSPAFQDALQALYGVSYTLKFMSKQRQDHPVDYSVMALEALWWIEGAAFDIKRPQDWHWTAMIMQPPHITHQMFDDGLTQLRRKKPNPSIDRLRLEVFHEGLSLQIMHIGPYATEPVSLARMQAFAQEHGYTYRGKHHEIYLGDPRRADPARLKTILRQPILKA